MSRGENKVKIYAKALAQVLEKPARQNAKAFVGEETDKIVKNFIKVLEKSGQMRKAKEILDLAEELLLKKQGKRKIVLESARKILDSQKKLFENFLKEGDKVEEKINKDLVAGIKIIVNGEKQIDYSLNKKLQEIFK